MTQKHCLFFTDTELKTFQRHWLLQTNTFIAHLCRKPVLIKPLKFLRLVTPQCKTLLYKGENYMTNEAFVSPDEYCASYVIRFLEILRIAYRDRAGLLMINCKRDAQRLENAYGGAPPRSTARRKGKHVVLSKANRRKELLFWLLAEITRQHDCAIDYIGDDVAKRDMNNADDFTHVQGTITAQCLCILRYNTFCKAYVNSEVDLETQDGKDYVLMTINVLKQFSNLWKFNLMDAMVAMPLLKPMHEIPMLEERAKCAMQASYNECMNELLLRVDTGVHDMALSQCHDSVAMRLNAVTLCE